MENFLGPQNGIRAEPFGENSKCEGRSLPQKEITVFGSAGEPKCICSCREHVAYKAIHWCSDYQVCGPLTWGRSENQSLKENASVKILWTKFFVLNTQGIALSVLSGGQAQSKWIPLIKLSKSLRRHQDAHLSTKINGYVGDHKCKGVHVIRKSPLSSNILGRQKNKQEATLSPSPVESLVSRNGSY